MTTQPSVLSSQEKYLGYLGWFCTAMGMCAQACFGVALLDYYIFSNWITVLRIVMDLIFFIAIEESKRRVITAHNEKNFQQLAHFNWRKLFNPRKWSWQEVLWQFYNFLLSFGGSHLFVAITGLNLDREYGAAQLLSSYQVSTFDHIADVLDDRFFQMTFMIAATIANILFFPQVIWLGTINLLHWVSNFAESPEYRAYREHVNNQIEAKRIELKAAVASNLATEIASLLDETNQFLNAVAALPNKNSDDLAINRFIDTTSVPEKASNDQRRMLHGFFAIIASGIGAAGFWNVYELGGDIATHKIMTIFFGGEVSWYAQLAPAFSVLGYLAMIFLCMGIIPSLVYELPRISYWGGDHVHIQTSSTIILWVNRVLALAICALGTTPNIFQADKLLHQPWYFIMLAAIASMLIEFQAARERCTPFNGSARDYVKSICSKQASQAQVLEVARADLQLIALQNQPNKIAQLTDTLGLFRSRYMYRTEENTALLTLEPPKIRKNDT